MTSIKLKPWPFEDRTVKLHWFGHVRLTLLNQWRITVAFEDQQKIVLIPYPIGLLPILRIGQYYQNGIPMISQKDGMIFTGHIQNLSLGQSSNTLEVCRRFNYYLYGKAELIKQKIWSIPCFGLIYHIPQVELIRALFIKNKILSNAMLRPNGIEYLLNGSRFVRSTATLDFSREVPASLINEHFVQHFIWLYTVPEVRSAFESIQTHVYAIATTHGLSHGQPLEMTVPAILDSHWTYRGKRYGNEVFVYELLSFTGAELPFDQIEYSHVSIKKRVYRKAARKRQNSKSGESEQYELDSENGSHAKEDTHQPIVEQEPTQMVFDKHPVIIRVAKYTQEINQGDTYISKQGRGGATTRTASVDESIIGGSIQPIEFKTLEITYERNGYGLEAFFEMIKELEKMNPEMMVSMTLVNLPTGRVFSWLPDGRRRTCAVVRIDRLARLPIYILEVARPDERSLSTLIVRLNSLTGRKEDEEQIQKLLEGLVFNSGTWRKEQLNIIRHVKLKHTSKNIRSWAEKVYERILVL